MKDVAIILLNYNSAEAVKQMVDVEIKKLLLPQNTEIIVIDNCSTDNSIKEFESWNKECIIIRNTENGGYAKGNNVGIHYAEKEGFKFAWILNSDVVFTDKYLLINMMEVLKRDPSIGVISPVVYSGKGNEMNRNLYRPSVFDLTFGRIRYRKKGRQIDPSLKGLDDTYCYNYKPQGCCMLLNIEILHNVGYLDEKTFMYMEEPILAERLLREKYRSALCLNSSVIHNHNSDYESEKQRLVIFKRQMKSEMYYYSEYRHFSKLQAFACECFTLIHHFFLMRFRKFK